MLLSSLAHLVVFPSLRYLLISSSAELMRFGGVHMYRNRVVQASKEPVDLLRASREQ